MHKKTVEHVDVRDQTVLVRCDFNVPLEDGTITDDTRIRASVPTLVHLLEGGAKLLLCSHLGRPEGEPRDELRLDPVAERLSKLLGCSVPKLNDCVGPEVAEAARRLKPGAAVVLENTRFHPEEQENDDDFARLLAEPADLFVNDAFGAAHRAHASTHGVGRHLPSVAGLLMARELEALTSVRDDPEEPVVWILGGAKASDKIGVMERFLDASDRILLGGGMANTFLAAKGLELGASLVEDGRVDDAAAMLERAPNRLVLPRDVVIARSKDAEAESRTVQVEEVESGWMIVDVGPETVEAFRRVLEGARTILWNGPLGVSEVPAFATGTREIAEVMSGLEAITVAGGGETSAVIHALGLAEQLDHVSTGGGAFLQFMEGRELPGVSVLEDA
ncbi:MAG: phosphoglycerate kinase [Gemmatimonadota bacterium]